MDAINCKFIGLGVGWRNFRARILSGFAIRSSATSFSRCFLRDGNSMCRRSLTAPLLHRVLYSTTTTRTPIDVLGAVLTPGANSPRSKRRYRFVINKFISIDAVKLWSLSFSVITEWDFRAKMRLCVQRWMVFSPKCGTPLENGTDTPWIVVPAAVFYSPPPSIPFPLDPQDLECCPDIQTTNLPHLIIKPEWS